MRIFQKLSLGFLTVAIFVGAAAYFTIGGVSQKVLEKTIGENAFLLVSETLDKTDREIYHRIEAMQMNAQALNLRETLAKSNQEFEAMADVQDYISRQDVEWKSLPKETVTPFMQGLIDNGSSMVLREKINFYTKLYDYKVYAEILVANKFGANAAQTEKTSDYFQYDEQCFQKANENGLWVEGVGYDESSRTHSIDFCHNIEDENGALLGTMKVVVNIEDVIAIIKQLDSQASFDADVRKSQISKSFTLIGGDGELIYSSAAHDPVHGPGKEFYASFKDAGAPGHADYVVRKKKGQAERLIAHAHSKGYKTYRGLGWVLLVTYETKEIFAPVYKLKQIMIVIIFGLTLILIIASLLIARFISMPLLKLKDSALEIGKGRLDLRVSIQSKDEIGILADAFNKMAENLKSTMVSKDYVDNIIGSMLDSLIVVDPSADIILVNEAACKILGYRQEELIGKSIFSIFANERMMNGWSMGRLIQEGVIKDYELLYKSKDGRTIPMLLCGAVLKKGDRQNDPSSSMGVVFVAKDISDRKKAEDLSAAIEQTEAAMKAKSQLLSNIANEFRAPVKTVTGLADLLLETTLDDTQRKHLHSIQTHGEGLLALISETLDILKLDSDKHESKPIEEN